MPAKSTYPTASPPGFFSTDLSPHWATALLLIAAFLWGTGNLANKTILTHVDPVSAVLLRTVIGAVVLAWPAWREWQRVRPLGWFHSVMPGSLSFAAALLLQQWAFQTATVTNASFLINTTCVLTPLLSVLIWRERLGRRTVLAAIFALVGALLMSGAWHSPGRVSFGDVLCLVSAGFYALWIIQTGVHLHRHQMPFATTLAQCLCTALIAAPFVLIWGPRDLTLWAEALPEAAYLGLFSTAIAFGLMAVAQTRVSASTAAILAAAESLFGSATGIVVLGERPAATVLTGAALILAAIVVMALRPELRPDRVPVKPVLRD